MRNDEIVNVIFEILRVSSFRIIADVQVAASTLDRANVTAGTLNDRSHIVE